MVNGGHYNHPNTYSSDGWIPTKEEIRKRQSIFNETHKTLKTILYLPQRTPTTILLNEAGNVPFEYTIKKETYATNKTNPGKKKPW